MPGRSFFPEFVLSGFLGFANIPGSRDEVRAFLQRRIRTYFAMLGTLWLLTFLLDAGAKLGLAASYDLGVQFDPRISTLHLAGGIFLWLPWLYLKRAERSISILHILDTGVTHLQAIVVGLVLAWNNPNWVPQYPMLLGLTHVLVARAAIVPSAPARSALLATVANVPLLIGTYWLYSHNAMPAFAIEANADPFGMVVGVAIWSLVAVIVTTTISAVIYGLEREVQAARQLGQYTLEEKIGEGSMGVVYRARHALLRRPTAVKLLPPEKAGEMALARFEREVQLTSGLTHPHTVAVYDYGRTPDGVFYYAMELLDGIDLQTLVEKDGPMPPARVLKVLGQVAGALAEAHAVGLIHRDVKPANLVLCRRGLELDFAKVLDFGLVRDTHTADPALSNVNVLAGTPLYMSPEQITSTALDGRSDLYALGAVAYYLLTGTTVFSGSSIVDVCSQHLYAPPERPSQRLGSALPATLEALVLACLEKDPARRPQSAEALIEALSACIDVPRWTALDAQAWWTTRGPTFTRTAEASSGPRTVAVDWVARV